MEINVNGVTLFYEASGSGRPLIMLHGNGETHEIFDAAIPLLSERYTVYAIDTRGHGKSSPVAEYHYRDMAQDIIAFIRELGLDKPVLYGFSDGGITALLVGFLAPELPSFLVGSGVNLSPYGLTREFLHESKLEWRKTKSPLIKLILTEPHIFRGALSKIRVPVYLTAGEHDLVRLSHTLRIACSIPQCGLRIFEGEDHASYIVHSEKIAAFLLDVLP